MPLGNTRNASEQHTALAGNNAWAEAGDSGDAAPVSAGPRNGRPALASSSKDSTCRDGQHNSMQRSSMFPHAASCLCATRARTLGLHQSLLDTKVRTSCCESALESHCRNRLSSFNFEHGNRLCVESRPKENMLPANPLPAFPAKGR